ncbi:conserved hypothetical protein [Roseibium sp. TrichSKD4]|uniref:hypothetical protein n=1 Tax=Roseibium sp. TrichSKD4 TaxID=744980 RepID=UPI0001E570D2|nr:hypothetical protein [Roseibium sp. TrichSKD4]EFO32322.1 conserved hypothetical protein [Roseibium sp. TrichSKD4]
MPEPKSTATIVALADLADFSADQLENGHSVDNVIALLRRAAIAVRETVDLPPEESELVAAFEPVVISNTDEIEESAASAEDGEEAAEDVTKEAEPVSA